MRNIVSAVVLSAVSMLVVDCLPSSPTEAAADAGGQQKNLCRNYNTDFTQSTEGWIAENSAQDTYELTPDGIRMNLVPPNSYVRMHDVQSKSSTHHILYAKACCRTG